MPLGISLDTGPMAILFEPHAGSLAQLQLEVQLQLQSQSQSQCGWPAHTGHDAADAGASADRTEAFLATLALIRADLQADLFPALRESMAGSDAVCIRDMQARAALQMDAIEVASRAGVTTGAAGRADSLSQACDALVRWEHDELLPMAERLLDDRAAAQVVRAMHARRAAGRPGL